MKGLVAVRKDLLLYLMLVLPISYYLVFHYIPMYGVVIAFQKYNIFKGVFGSEWVGFDVFRGIFELREFRQAFRNTLAISLLQLLFGFPAPIILALMLNELISVRLQRVLQTTLYLPHFIGMVIIAGIAYEMFGASHGIINRLLTSVGFGAIPFMTDNGWWLTTFIGIGIWKEVGWGTIIYLAAITAINPELYEAANVDGCGRFRKMWNITLPGIAPTISILLILTTGSMMATGFEAPYLLGNVLVRDVSDVLATFVYRVGLQNANYSVATAVGLFQSVINMILLLLANQMAKRAGGDGIW
jgi:putative aldouronate transport system permease protein